MAEPSGRQASFMWIEQSHIWPFRLNITFGWLQKLNPGSGICIISYQVNLSSEVSAMFNSLMPSLNIRSLPFVVFLGGFPSRCQNLSSRAVRPGGLLLDDWLPKVTPHPVCCKSRLGGAWMVVRYKWSSNKTGILGMGSPTTNSPVVGGAPVYGFHPSQDPRGSDDHASQDPRGSDDHAHFWVCSSQ